METGESGADAPDAPGAHTFVPEDELNFLAIISVSNEWPRAGKAIAID